MQGTSRFFWGCLSSEGRQDLMIERGLSFTRDGLPISDTNIRCDLNDE